MRYIDDDCNRQSTEEIISWITSGGIAATGVAGAEDRPRKAASNSWVAWVGEQAV